LIVLITRYNQNFFILFSSIFVIQKL
jgi:hypothetical protein